MVAADDYRRADGAAPDEFVESEAGAVTLAIAEPADACRKTLERDLLVDLVEPAVERVVVRELLAHRLVGRFDVGRLAGKRHPPKWALALTEQRADVGRHE